MKNVLKIVLLASTLVALPAISSAHTALSSSNIVAGSEINGAPQQLELKFGQAVGLAAVELVGPENEMNVLKTVRSMKKAHLVELPHMAPGVYVLRWRAVAKDGHVMTGEIPFTVLAD